MKKLKLSLIMLLALCLVFGTMSGILPGEYGKSIASASTVPLEEKWIKLNGGISNTDYSLLPFTAEYVEDGLKISASSNHGFDGHVPGVILNEQIDINDFSVEFTLNEVAGYRDKGLDHRFIISLLSGNNYFHRESANTMQGLVLDIFPKIRNIDDNPSEPGLVETDLYYTTSTGLTKIHTAWLYLDDWDQPITIEYITDDQNVSTLKFNNQDVATSDQLAVIDSNWFPNDKAYFSIGAKAGADLPYSFTLNSVNDATTLPASLQNKAKLTDLTFSTGNLTPAFSSLQMDYILRVDHDVTTVDVTPISDSTITINDTAHSSNTGYSIPLEIGDNNVTINVSQAHYTSSEYTIVIRRSNLESPWTKLGGGWLNSDYSRVQFDANYTEQGIQVVGTGNYDSSGNATGVLLESPLDQKNVSVKFSIDQITGFTENSISNWYAVSILDKPKLFSLNDTASARGLIVFIYPKNGNELDLQVYRIADEQPGDAEYFYKHPDIPGYLGVGGGTVNLSVNEPLLLEYKTDAAGTSSLTLNGISIADPNNLKYVKSSFFEQGKAYLSVSSASSVDTPFKFTVQEVNHQSVLPTAELSGLQIGTGTQTPAFFSPAVYEYDVTVNSINPIIITPLTDMTDAVITINGAQVNNNEAVALPIPNKNIFTIVVSKDGYQSKTYTIHVKRQINNIVIFPVDKSSNNFLGSLSITGETESITLSPTFNEEISSYSASTTENSVVIHAVAADKSATINSPSNVTLTEGRNQIVIAVTAEDGNTRKYTIDITGVKSAIEEPSSEIDQTQPSIQFSDTKGHWAEQVISIAIDKGWIKGYSDGTFRPEGNVTRAEFATVLTRVLNLSGDPNVLSGYKDVPSNSTFAHAMAALIEVGLMQGKGNQTLAPSSSMTREELAVLLIRTYNYKQNNQVAYKSEVRILSIEDQDNVSTWARSAVTQAVELGLMKGRSSSSFAPKELVKRAEIIAALVNLVDQLPDQSNELIYGDWKTLIGGIKSNGQRGSIILEETSQGIQIKGQGNYDFSGNATGMILNTPINTDTLSFEVSIDQIAGWGDDGVDSWYNFNLLNNPKYFTLGDPAAAKGVTIFVRPRSSTQLGIEVYRLSEPQPGDENDWVAGWHGIGGGIVDVAWNSKLKVEYKSTKVAGEGLYVNGQKIDMDLSQINSSWFTNNNAYFSAGAASAYDNEISFTIHSVNGRKVQLEENEEEMAARKQWLEQVMVPFWIGNTMFEESVMITEKVGRISDPTLLFKPIDIIKVTNAAGDVEYIEGKDWVFNEGKLTIPSQSSVPITSDDILYPTTYIEGQMYTKLGGGGYVLYRESSYFLDKQIKVTYTHAEDAWQGPVPQFAGNQLTHTLDKLNNQEPIKLVLFGDSISEGQNASGKVGVAPFLPIWGELVASNLRETYNTEINFVNPSVGGKDSEWGKQEADRLVASESPDLAIIAFGMNDGTMNVTPQSFKANIESIINQVRSKNPNTEFILVATSLPNKITEFFKQQPFYKTVLDQLAGDGIVVADMTGVHAELLTNKNFNDMTGNHINHPNDFLTRWYAQYVLGILIP